jgi:hypothetical protein
MFSAAFRARIRKRHRRERAAFSGDHLQGFQERSPVQQMYVPPLGPNAFFDDVRLDAWPEKGYRCVIESASGQIQITAFRQSGAIYDISVEHGFHPLVVVRFGAARVDVGMAAPVQNIMTQEARQIRQRRFFPRFFQHRGKHPPGRLVVASGAVVGNVGASVRLIEKEDVRPCSPMSNSPR